ncbi:hypothetical protein QJS10_CPB14g01525 [Acorus calamus]|uniref:Reverse transcriptase n=1 Tax=Acorus calamus TaxID=4465 RepID=A0AAV9DEY7_ACOCL|nr:hypothetical protein QJS10_CPB14g01525 [Acorus calamus]
MGWIIGGDFNEVRYSHEKLGGQPVHSRRLRKFNSCILSSGLEDLKSIGHTLSWNNRQDSRIFCRLDRVMGNQPFITAFPHSLVEYLPPGISDHSPLKLVCEPSYPSGPKPFKYFEAWETHPSFMNTVQEAWKADFSGNPLFQFVRKLANVKKTLKVWNKDVFGPIQFNLSITKKDLADAQIALQLHPSDQRPLFEGGLGIKTITDWNRGAAGVRFWEIVSRKNSLWSVWASKRYLRNKNIWQAPAPSGCSSSWSIILKARLWIASKVQFIIFEGKAINIWWDPWLNGFGLKHYLGRPSYIWGPPSSASLDILIHNGSWRKPPRWPVSLDGIWQDIIQIEVGGTGEDVLNERVSPSTRLRTA